MRTTLSIDDDILDVVKYLANQQKVAIGAVLSDLARKGLQHQKTNDGIDIKGDFPVFTASKNATPVTPDQVKRLEDDV